VLKPIPSYPVYIHDHNGTLWGVPSTAMGIEHKERIQVETIEGKVVNGFDFYTIGGVIYLSHGYTLSEEGEEPVSFTDYYQQFDGEIELVDAIPSKPVEKHATLDSSDWFIESATISGVPFSYLYTRNPAIVDAMGGSIEKGAFIRRWPMISGYAELDRGLLIMTNDGGLFIPSNRTAPNEFSEQGRIWK
jgi:hypothetical protein